MGGSFGRSLRKTILSLRPWAWGVLLLLLAFLVAFPFIFSELPYRITLVFSILIYVTLAESYDIVGGYMGYINLGHTAFFAIGAYAFGIALRNDVSLLPAFLIAALAAAVFALLISYPLFRLRGMYFAIATFGLIGLLNLLAFNLDQVTVVNPVSGSELSLGTGGSFGLPAPTGDLRQEAYWMALSIALVTIGLNFGVSRSRFGLALVSIREDEEVAVAFGVRAQLYKTLALALSSITPGLAGAVFLTQITYIEPNSVLGLEIVLIPVVMAMLGGSGSTLGPLIGALFIMLVQEIVFIRVEHYRLAIYGLILAAVGLFMPGGIVGQRWFRKVSDRVAGMAKSPAAPHSAAASEQGRVPASD